ncbi:MAG: sigma-70 family RNA polymerase sigma factor [Deltaproteobacteria bacterium]|nr:sigma-70 family RNA polymerase sigma factor [Deltaproteobacteria bacterium]
MSAAEERQAREERWRTSMAAAQDGDAKAYESLLQELLPEIRSLVRRRLPDEAAVEDIVQNTLLAIHRSRHTYRSERPFGPWMRAVARNAFLDHVRVRSRRVEREVPLDAVPEPADDPAPMLERVGLSPELERALAELPAAQREAVELIQLRGLSVAEAAVKAGVSMSAVKVRAHRGYRALRARLEGVEGFRDG